MKHCSIFISVFCLSILSSFKLIGNCADCSCENCTCDGDWSFNIAPYAWGAGLRGDVGTLPRLPVVSVDMSFSDILRHMDATIMLAGEVRKGQVSLAADIMYVDISRNVTTKGPRIINASLDVKYWIATIAFGCVIIRNDFLILEAFLGGRIWSITTDLSLGAQFLPDVALSIKATKKWMDPLVGIRGSIPLGCNFSIKGWGIVGGFDVSSKIFWDFLGTLGYTWNFCDSSIDLLVGYRWMSVDYKTCDFLYDVKQFGPIIGLVFSF